MDLFTAGVLLLNLILCAILFCLSMVNLKKDAQAKDLDKKINKLSAHVNEIVEATNANTISMQKAFEGNSTEIQDIIKRMEAAEDGIRQADKKATEISKYYCNYVSREGYNK